MNGEELAVYDKAEEELTANEDNPIKIFNSLSTKINLIPSKFKKLDELTEDGREYNIIINAGGRFPNMIKKHLTNKNVVFYSYHEKDLTKFEKLDNIVLLETPIVKPYKLFYIDARFKKDAKVYLFRLDNPLENMFYERVFNNELRNDFDKHFGK